MNELGINSREPKTGGYRNWVVVYQSARNLLVKPGRLVRILKAFLGQKEAFFLESLAKGLGIRGLRSFGNLRAPLNFNERRLVFGKNNKVARKLGNPKQGVTVSPTSPTVQFA